MADDDTPQLADRVGTIEGKVDQIITRLGELVRGTGPAAGAHATAAEVTNARLEPQTVEEQVAAALEAKDRQAKEAALHEDVASLKEATAALAEKPPEPPQRRVEKVMGWGR
jgi:heme oxygenase